jgi:hypothetical protein
VASSSSADHPCTPVIGNPCSIFLFAMHSNRSGTLVSCIPYPSGHVPRYL